MNRLSQKNLSQNLKRQLQLSPLRTPRYDLNLKELGLNLTLSRAQPFMDKRNVLSSE
jgi:hypothetical protein